LIDFTLYGDYTYLSTFLAGFFEEISIFCSDFSMVSSFALWFRL